MHKQFSKWLAGAALAGIAAMPAWAQKTVTFAYQDMVISKVEANEREWLLGLYSDNKVLRRMSSEDNPSSWRMRSLSATIPGWESIRGCGAFTSRMH